MSPLRIGILATFFRIEPESDSGIGLLYRVLADGLAQQGHAVHVVHPTDRPARALAGLRTLAPPWTYDVVPAQVPWPARWVAGGGSWQRRALLERFWAARCADRALARACLRRKLEVVETHAFAAPALHFLRRRQRPVVISRLATTTAQMLAGSPVSSRALRWLAQAEQQGARASDALLAHSAVHRDEVCALEGYDRARCGLVPLGISDPGAAPVEAADGAVEFLFVGRFEERKGIDVLLEAIPTVAAACPAATFVLAGDQGSGEDWRRFRERHPELVPGRVRALGRVGAPALDALYRNCSVLVAPSRYESFGLIYVEAMSRGRPVIGCRAGGIPEVVSDGRTGLLAAPGDPASLAACMLRLGADGALRRELGAAGRRDFLERFSAAEFARRSTAFYRTVLGQS